MRSRQHLKAKTVAQLLTVLAADTRDKECVDDRPYDTDQAQGHSTQDKKSHCATDAAKVETMTTKDSEEGP